MTVLRGFQKTSQWEANASPFVQANFQAPILGIVLSMSEVHTDVFTSDWGRARPHIPHPHRGGAADAPRPCVRRSLSRDIGSSPFKKNKRRRHEHCSVRCNACHILALAAWRSWLDVTCSSSPSTPPAMPLCRPHSCEYVCAVSISRIRRSLRPSPTFGATPPRRHFASLATRARPRSSARRSARVQLTRPSIQWTRRRCEEKSRVSQNCRRCWWCRLSCALTALARVPRCAGELRAPPHHRHA